MTFACKVYDLDHCETPDIPIFCPYEIQTEFHGCLEWTCWPTDTTTSTTTTSTTTTSTTSTSPFTTTTSFPPIPPSEVSFSWSMIIAIVFGSIIGFLLGFILWWVVRWFIANRVRGQPLAGAGVRGDRGRNDVEQGRPQVPGAQVAVPQRQPIQQPPSVPPPQPIQQRPPTVPAADPIQQHRLVVAQPQPKQHQPAAHVGVQLNPQQHQTRDQVNQVLLTMNNFRLVYLLFSCTINLTITKHLSLCLIYIIILAIYS